MYDELPSWLQIGFTENNNNGLREYLDYDYYDYANAIILSRNGKLKESLVILNKLINKYNKFEHYRIKIQNNFKNYIKI